MRSGEEDFTARAVIRNRALELFAERGSDAVSVREIATAAKVSPGLVLHHYGSKAGLRTAVDTYVAGVFDDALVNLTEHPKELLGDVEQGAATFADLLLSGLPGGSAVPMYLRRLLLSGDHAGNDLFVRWHELTMRINQELAAAGVLRPSDDPVVRAAFLIANDLAVLLLRDQIGEVLGIDPLSSEGLKRWTADVLAAYSDGVFNKEGTS